MRLKTAALLASVWLASSGVALGQTSMGNEVTVNPIPYGGGVLLYPGGQYMRVVPPLLTPGQSLKANGPVRLHMPGKRPAMAAATRPAPKRAPRMAAAAPAAAPAPAPPASMGGFGTLSPVGPSLAPPAETPRPKPEPAPRAKPAPAPAKPAQLARAEPPPTSSLAPVAPAPDALFPGLTKRSMISFLPQQTDPAQSALGAIKFLATDLNTAMTGPGSRIQLMAYAGKRGDKDSDARRLSLKRALAIRQVLIDDGVPAERIDVHAMGGVDDSGPTDRVDVYIKA